MNYIMNKASEANIGKNLVFDANENDFVNKVINESDNQLVLVDFWAPWCGPCKQLGPVLEEIVNEADGKIKLAKVNIDENQQIAAQLRIQSIPTVMGFLNKQISDGFQGSIPKSKIIEFIEKIIGEKLHKDHNNFYKEIEELISSKKYNETKDMIEDFLTENSNDVKAISFYIKCLIELKNFKEAKDFVSSLDDETLKDQNVQSSIKILEIKEKNIGGPEEEELENQYKNNPKDLDNILLLSEKYFSLNKSENSFELLLNEFINFKNKDREKIKETLIKYFDALGNEHESTKIYRRRLSTLLFS